MSAHAGAEPDQVWLEELGRLRAAGRAAVVVVVTDVQGSAPREAGARMLVDEDGLAWGTIGGGNLERLALKEARELLGRPGEGPRTRSFPLAESAGQCCGGKVTLFFEPYRWRRRRVVVFGAGHVGQALASLAPWMKADVTLVDPREASELVPRPPEERPYRLELVDAPEDELAGLPDDALVVVMTHSHDLDLRLIEAALDRGGFAFLGLIGSDRKWKRFAARLERKGRTSEELARVTCPIGVSVGSKDPAAIALSTATQLVECMQRRVGVAGA